VERSSPAPVLAVQEPKDVAPPSIAESDSPRVKAAKLGRFMEARWPRVHLEPDANALGTVAAFGITIDYDPYRGNDRAWEQSVHQVASDLREASVELLQLSAKYFPHLRYATVWEDRRLIFFWSKRQIERMGPAWLYRDFNAYLALTRVAEFQPPLLVYAREHEPRPSAITTQ